MERQSKLRIKILKFLAQAAAPAVTFKSPPSSPRNHPKVSIIPREARRKPRNGSSTFATKEPTSPKVSCMGQVEGKKKKKKKSKPKPKQVCPPPLAQESTSLALCFPKQKKTLKLSTFILKDIIKQKGKDVDSVATSSSSSRSIHTPQGVPSLGQMKRFESGRGVLSDFGFVKVDGDDPHFIEDLKLEVGEKEEENKKEVIVLWKRRSMSPPKPLEL